MQEAYNTQSTTEELIIAYLDGELVRKELEVELFDRLAMSMEARTILRDHLVIRGAIKQSLLDDQFILSEDLDQRTRARLEEILENVSQPAIATRSTRLADAPPARMEPATRALKRWKYATAALLALLAFGTTWFFTQGDEHVGAPLAGGDRVAEQPLATNSQPQTSASQEVTKPTASTERSVTPAVTSEDKPKVIVKTVVKYVPRPASSNVATNAPGAIDKSNDIVQEQPSEVLMPARFSKARNKKTNTVIISDKDRI